MHLCSVQYTQGLYFYSLACSGVTSYFVLADVAKLCQHTAAEGALRSEVCAAFALCFISYHNSVT